MDNDLKACPKDGDEDSDSQTINVNAGAPVSMEVVVSAADTNGLTCEWYDDEDNLIEGADSTAYVIDSAKNNGVYNFRVTDQYGNTASVSFTIIIENHLTARAEDPADYDGALKILYIEPGKSANLNVIVSADDMSQLTYEWRDDDMNQIEGADSASYVVDSVTKPQNYYFDVADQYGNSVSVFFVIIVENHLTAYPEGEDSDSNYKDIHVIPGGSAELKAIVTADDMSQITCKWFDNDHNPVEPADPFSYTVDDVTEYQQYGLEVSDQYKNTAFVYFYIYPDNGLNAYPEGEDKEKNSKDISVSPGSPVDLKLFVSADDMSQLTYTWFDDNEEEETVIDGADSLSYSIASVTEKHGYSYLVEDQYGNASSVSFIVDLLDYSDPQIIKDGDTREVSVTEESPYVLYEFTPTETADYTVSSSDNNTDPFVEVFNDSYELLYINDDGGEDGNFKLTELFTSGTTYYIRAKAFDTSSDGNYLIHLEKEPLLRQIIKAEEEMSLEYGNSGTISVTGAQGTLHFTSSKPAIVSVDSTGKVTANKIGTTDITIFADATETHYQSKTITVSVTVKKASIKNADVTGIVNKTYNGSEQTQTPVVKAGSATLTEGTDYTIDSYSDNINAGTASVTISGKGNYTDTVVKTFTIEKAAQNFTVKAGASAINVGKTTKVTASGAKETQKYTFTSSNNKIAAVNAAGTVTGKAAGTVTITVKTAETANYKAGSKTVKITVNKVLNCQVEQFQVHQLPDRLE